MGKGKRLKGQKGFTTVETEQIARDVSQQVLNNYSNKVASALEATFREEYGFGDKRMKKLLDQLNSRLPESVRFVYKDI